MKKCTYCRVQKDFNEFGKDTPIDVMTISYPRPPYANPVIDPEDYQPSVFEISSITPGSQTVVQTTEDHNYVVGQQVRFNIPVENATRELNGLSGLIVDLPADDQITVNINSTNFTTFVTTTDGTQPQVKAIGDVNTGQINTNISNTTEFIPGSFRNISP